MTIQLPIQLEQKRPIEPPGSPYNQCGYCYYVGIDVQLAAKCPVCKKYLGGCIGWPDPSLIELWHDEIFCWNNEKPELAIIINAMYFEASVFDLIHAGVRWLDPQLNLIGAEYEEVPDRQERIWRYFDTINNRKKTEDALQKLFGVDGNTMLRTVLGTDARPFYENYLRMSNWRNQIAHRGRRIYYDTVPEHMQDDDEHVKQHILWASLNFIPECWVVFSQLWNEFIHKPMYERNNTN
ncbi:MAG: hypothetical protein ACYTF1_00475 [Planctomycetota bacterium]|jgi:hypothetical protein